MDPGREGLPALCRALRTSRHHTTSARRASPSELSETIVFLLLSPCRSLGEPIIALRAPTMLRSAALPGRRHGHRRGPRDEAARASEPPRRRSLHDASGGAPRSPFAAAPLAAAPASSSSSILRLSREEAERGDDPRAVTCSSPREHVVAVGAARSRASTRRLSHWPVLRPSQPRVASSESASSRLEDAPSESDRRRSALCSRF